MLLIDSPVITPVIVGLLMFVLGFFAGELKAERRNKIYRRIWGL